VEDTAVDAPETRSRVRDGIDLGFPTAPGDSDGQGRGENNCSAEPHELLDGAVVVVLVVVVEVDVEVLVETFTVVVVVDADELLVEVCSSACSSACSAGTGSNSVARTLASCVMSSSTFACSSRAVRSDFSKSFKLL
jgi:hypothetical protein